MQSVIKLYKMFRYAERKGRNGEKGAQKLGEDRQIDKVAVCDRSEASNCHITYTPREQTVRQIHLRIHLHTQIQKQIQIQILRLRQHEPRTYVRGDVSTANEWKCQLNMRQYHVDGENFPFGDRTTSKGK